MRFQDDAEPLPEDEVPTAEEPAEDEATPKESADPAAGGKSKPLVDEKSILEKMNLNDVIQGKSYKKYQ